MLQGATAFARVGAINHVRSPYVFSLIFYKEACSFGITQQYTVAREVPHHLELHLFTIGAISTGWSSHASNNFGMV